MKPSRQFKLLIALAVLTISGLAVAQDESSDPPSRVVRLQHVEGQVSMQPGGVDDWVAANLNRPLTTADRIWTDVDSRAELSMASAVLRMGSETSVTLTNLDDNTAQIELDQGTLNLAVRYLNPGDIVEVDTPNFAYTVFKPGEYRFEVLPNQDTSWITVRRGDGEATGQGDAVRVHARQQFSFSQGQSLNYQDSAMRPNDDFDNWSEMRERRETLSASARYVAAGTVGYEDLDENGDWSPSAAYGTVWYPRVQAGWAPYRDGHWAWVEPWGWTWVDDAPWGFAPFHYGRWVNDGSRWGWVPGPVGVRPVYAPALVAWVGGASFGVSIGIGGGGGGVGWFPLGWHDPYLPSYHVSQEYARNVNISNSRVVNVTQVNNYYSSTNVNVRNTTINNIHYENATVRGAATGVSSSTFASGKSVGRNSVVVPASAVRPTSMMTSAAVVPTKEAVLGGRAPAAVPQHIVAPRQVVSKAAPPQRPVSFEQQRPLLEKSNGVPLSKETRATIRAANPAPAPRGGQPAGNPQGGRAPVTNQPGGNQQRPGVANQPGGNQQRPGVANQPGGNQQRPGVANQPGGNQQRPPVPNQPGGNQQGGRPPAANAPAAPRPGVNTSAPEAGTAHGQPNSPNTPGRPQTPATPPANANQNTAPGRNVPRPPAANTPAARPGETPNRPVTPPAPARETAPAPPPRNAAPARETAPAPPPRNAPPAPAAQRTPPPAAPRTPPPAAQRTPPPATATPAPRKTPPPAKENKTDKEKDKEPK
jgi:hypothetical protein